MNTKIIGQWEDQDINGSDVPSSQLSFVDAFSEKAANEKAFHKTYKDIDHYRVLEVGKTTRMLKSPISLNGKSVLKYEAYDVHAYVDTTTQETYTADALSRVPGAPKPYHASELALQRVHILNSLHPQVKPFASFVLQFRNLWRGFTPGMDTLVKWYADLSDKRPQDVRRYVARLEKAGICNGDTLLPPFQLTGGTANATQQRAALLEAESWFSILMLQKLSPSPLGVTTCPRHAVSMPCLRCIVEQARPRSV